jgi:hypothetical protein
MPRPIISDARKRSNIARQSRRSRPLAPAAISKLLDWLLKNIANRITAMVIKHLPLDI